MVTQRKSRLEQLENVPPLSTWPTITDSILNEKNRERFQNRSTAVKMYVEGYPVMEIAKVTGISRSALGKFADRCLETANDGKIMGFRALIPNLPQKLYRRVAEITHKYPEAQGGLSGAFRQTLEQFPDIEEKLVKLVRKINNPDHNVHEKKIGATTIWREFIKLLKEKGVGPTQWPFNTKHLGRKTLQRFLNETLDETFARSITTREERAAVAHLAVGTGYAPLLRFEEPYDCVEIDAFCINAFFSAEFETPEGTTTAVQLERIWLIAMIEAVSSAVLAYNTVYRSEVSAEDVLRVIRKAINPPERLELTIPGLVYPKDGGLPNEIFPECEGAAWNALLLDGALAHLAQAIHVRARKTIGFEINWGPVGHFEHRPNIERLFSDISSAIFLRMPSTTGSHPHKGRAKDAQENSVSYKILAEEVEQLLAVHMAQHNVTPSEGISYNCPLDVLHYYINKKSDHFVIRHLPARSGSGAISFPILLTPTVRGGRNSGRRPYVEIDRVHYTNPVLAQTAGLIGKKLTVEMNEDDWRYGKAFLENGAELGIIKAGGRWCQTKHSRKTRKLINSLVAKRELVITSIDDPIQVYLNYLSIKKKKSGSSNNKPLLTPRNATEATRVSSEFGLPRKIVNKKNTQSPLVSSIDELYLSRPSAIAGPMPDLNALLAKKTQK